MPGGTWLPNQILKASRGVAVADQSRWSVQWRSQRWFFPIRYLTTDIHPVLGASTPILSPAYNDVAGSDVLARAKKFGISNLNSLIIDSTSRQLPLMANFTRRHNLDLWCIILDFQRSRSGHDGVRNVFRAMKSHLGQAFPFQGHHADHLWDSFIDAHLDGAKLLSPLCDFEINRGAQRPDFFFEIFHKVLEKGGTDSRLTIANKIKQFHRVDRDDLLRLFAAACESKADSALEIYCNLYALFPGNHIYDDVIQQLFGREREADAWKLHRFLLSLADLPRDPTSVEPFVKILARDGVGLQGFLNDLSQAGVSFEAQIRRSYDRERTKVAGHSPGSLNIVVSHTLGVRPRTLSDEFVARAFATRSLSFDFVMSGLHMLGLISVGPLSVRQIALAAGSATALEERLTRLQAAGIDTGSSNYVRMVKKLATGGHTRLLETLLQSDQHPDVFENYHMQRKLLAYYLHARDWPRINQSLLALDAHTSSGHSPAWCLLEAAVQAKDWSMAERLAEKLINEQQSSNSRLITHLRDTVLTPRRPSDGRMSQSEVEHTNFFISVLRKVCESGKQISPGIWREPLVRLGMLGLWARMEHTMLWVASWYCKGPGRRLHRPSHGSERMIDSLFDARMQRAIIYWSFVQPADLNQVESAMRGTRLLRQLNMDYGVPVRMDVVRRAFMVSLRNLFSVGGMSKLLRNRQRRAANAASLHSLIGAFYQVWEQPLSTEEQTLIARFALTPSNIGERSVRRLKSTNRWQQNQDSQMMAARRLRQTRRERPELSMHKNGSGPGSSNSVAPADSSCAQQESQEDVVVYQDLFNPSWQEYKQK